MKKLAKRSIDLLIQKNWLNTINREIDKCNHYAAESRKHREVARALMKRYNEIYGGELSDNRTTE